MKQIRYNVTKLLFTCDSPHYEDLLSYEEMKEIVGYDEIKLKNILLDEARKPHDLNCILFVAAINLYTNIINSILSDERFVHPDKIDLKYFKQKMITDIVKYEGFGEKECIDPPDSIRGCFAEKMDDIISRHFLYEKKIRLLKYLLIKFKITTYVRSGQEDILYYEITPSVKDEELFYVLKLLDKKYLIHYATNEKIAECDKCGNTKLANILRSKL